MNKMLSCAGLVLFGTIFWGCFKAWDPTPDTPFLEEDKLPLATQEGKNTFGCLVNGKAWEPSWSIYPTLQTSFYMLKDVNGNVTSSGFGTIAQKQSNGSLEYIHLSLKRQNELISTGKYLLSPGEVSYSDDKAICLSSQEFQNMDGFIEITRLDTVYKIASGIFEFNAFHQNCQDTIRVTKGRFDLHFY